MQGIYKIANKQNNKCYIGKSNNIDRRFRDHKRIAFQEDDKEYNKALYQAFRKYGLDNFTFEVIEELKDYSLSGEREIYWINYYNSYNNGYNETKGGDGGSKKGHCAGQNNGRAKLTIEDVIRIRTLYKEGISRKDCYELFKDKISEGGFGQVWLGRTWTFVMPEVYTEENKKRNACLGKSKKAISSRKFTLEQVHEIRKRRDNGELPSHVYKDYQNICSKPCFLDLWYDKTYRE